MRNIFGWITACLSLILLLNGCTSAKKLICRSWQVEKVEFGPPGDEKEAKIQEVLKAEAPNLSFVFNADSTYVGGQKGQLVKGLWWFVERKKAMVMTSAQVQSHAAIITLNKNKMVMEDTGPQGTKVRFIMSPVPATK